MVKRISTTLLLLFFLAPLVHAQQENKDEKLDKNIVKLNVSSILLKTACIQYERILSNKISVTGNIIYRPKEIFAPMFVETSWYLTQEQLSVFAFTPSIRYYFGKHAGRGFYNELYMRYRRDALAAQTPPTAFSQGTFYHSGKENMLSGGLLFGYQMYKRKNVVLDFWIIGFGLGKTSFSSSSEFERRDQFAPITTIIKERYENVLRELYGDKGTITWNGERAEHKIDQTLFTFRGFGVNLGIRF